MPASPSKSSPSSLPLTTYVYRARSFLGLFVSLLSRYPVSLSPPYTRWIRVGHSSQIYARKPNLLRNGVSKRVQWSAVFMRCFSPHRTYVRSSLAYNFRFIGYETALSNFRQKIVRGFRIATATADGRNGCLLRTCNAQSDGIAYRFSIVDDTPRVLRPI